MKGSGCVLRRFLGSSTYKRTGEKAKVGKRGCETKTHTQGHAVFTNLTGVGLSAAEGPLSVDPGWSEGFTFPQCPFRGPGTAQDGFRYGLDDFLAQITRRGPW